MKQIHSSTVSDPDPDPPVEGRDPGPDPARDPDPDPPTTMQNFNTQVGGSGPRIRIRIHQMDPRIRIRIQPRTSWIRNTGSGIVVLDYRFRSKVSLSSYRMKFVWLKSIRGLGQQAGKLNLKIELYFCGLNLNICGGGGREGGIMYTMYFIHMW